jgi:hypothetical protein
LRKRSRRKLSAKATLLTPQEQVELLIAPRVHLDLILARHRNAAYLQSVIGLFDMAIALANLLGQTVQSANYERAQWTLESMARGIPSADDAELDIVRASFNQACRAICREDRRRLAEATIGAERRSEMRRLRSISEPIPRARKAA